jgi:hypothetical protein
MIKKPKDMNAATFDCIQRALVLCKAEKIDFETSYIRLSKASGISAGTDFLVEVERTMDEKKLSRAAATRFVITENPKLHSDWLESQNK